MANTKLNFIHICDTAFPSEQGNLNIIGIFENILVANFPSIHPRITIVFNVSASSGSHEFKLRVVDDHNQDIAPVIEGGFVIDSNIKTFGFIGTLGNISFQREGIYSVKVEADNRVIGGTDFKVIKLGIN